MNDTATSLSSGNEPESPLQGIAELSHLGVIRVEGDDAAKFLHGQLTQDFSLLGTDRARLAGFCNAKGRMQASFIGFKQNQSDILLVCSRDLLAATLKRLSMFVMRSKVKLSDATDAYMLYGMAVPARQPSDVAPWTISRNGDAVSIALYPAVGAARQLVVAPAASPAPAGESLALSAWLWGEVRSGVATLSQPLFEAFVPQMLNYESVGGVNFKKGCYPGQEVVARSQFRGTLKRRAHLFHASEAMHAGQEVFQGSDAEQPAGLVVQAAAAPGGGWDAIVSLQISALEQGNLHLSSVSGASLEHLSLPYGLLEDV